jgi:hypothetical protein
MFFVERNLRWTNSSDIKKFKDLGKKMAKKTGKKTNEKLQGYVIVTFAQDFDDASDYESLLKDNDIPAVIRKEEDSDGLAVMVPEDMIEEAQILIDSDNNYKDIYDVMVFEDQADDFPEEDYFDNF